MDPIQFNFHANFINEFENINNRNILRLEYRKIRDQSNPFEIPQEKFIVLFRLNKHLAQNLIEELGSFVEGFKRRDEIPWFLQVFIALNFYASGGYQTRIGQDLNLAVSQPVVSRIINKISDIFAIHMLPRYVKFPTTDVDIVQIKEGFMTKLNFPNTIGAIDCTHIAILAPNVDDPNMPAATYLNRKGYHSINVQAICDANMVFLNVNARYPGATHDAAIWETSTVNRHLRRRFQLGVRNAWLIGDSGYPIQLWMMTPINDVNPNSPEGIYSARHRRARNVIERSFGVLKQRWRCLHRHRVLHYSHGTAGKIIYACIILHNLCRQYNMPEIELNEDNHNEEPFHHIAVENDIDVDLLNEGRLIRRGLVNVINNN